MAAAGTTPLPGAAPPPVITIDGSLHEGGGQIVRNAVALSACTRTPLAVTAIRAGRPKPGLRPQHVAGLRLVASLSEGARLAGCEVGSTDLAFTPGHLRAGGATPHVADAGTAGSTTLMAQAALPAALLAGGRPAPPPPPALAQPPPPALAQPAPPCPLTTVLDLRGGTDAAMAPPFDFAALVLLPTLRQVCGIRADLTMHRRGFFPRGGGRVELAVRSLLPGQALPPLVLERGGAVSGGGGSGGGRDREDPITAIAVHAVHAGQVSRGAVDAAVAALVAGFSGAWAEAGRGAPGPPLPAWLPPTITALAPSAAAPGDGGSLTAVATSASGLRFGASSPLAPKDDAAALGARLGRELAEDAGPPDASVDRWAADQLVVFAALASGTSRWTTAGPPTPHALAAMEVAATLTGATFCVRQLGGGGWVFECQGAGVGAGG